jgi:RNA polymerase sigma-70 factor (ECF subfamily)
MDPIARAQAGDRAALSQLYSTYRGPIYQFLAYRTGDGQAAADLTSEVFARMMRALPRYQAGAVPFKAWLFQIARNLVIDYYRRQKVRDHAPLNDHLQADTPSPERYAARQLTHDRLAEALQQLTPAQMEVVILRVVLEMPIKEVAAAVGKSEDAVKGLQRRGLMALRDLLEREDVM